MAKDLAMAFFQRHQQIAAFLLSKVGSRQNAVVRFLANPGDVLLISGQQIAESQRRPLGKNDLAFNYVFQFADISRPVVVLQLFQLTE